jgi:hypothetical protein
MAVPVIASNVALLTDSIEVYLDTAAEVDAPVVLYACTLLMYCVFADNPDSAVDVVLAAAFTSILPNSFNILNPASFVELSVQVYPNCVADPAVEVKFVGAAGAGICEVVRIPTSVVEVNVPSPFFVVILKLYGVFAISPVLCHVLLCIHPLFVPAVTF